MVTKLDEPNGVWHTQFLYQSRKSLGGNLGASPGSLFGLCLHEKFASETKLIGSPLFYPNFVRRFLEIDRRLLYDYLTYCRYDKVGRTECPHDVANYP
jgi:hypothetical protein